MTVFERIFLSICNMTLTGCFVVLFILLARLCLRKLPRIYSYVLWAVAGLRLLVPFSFEAKRTLIPVKSEVITPEILIPDAPAIDSGIVILDEVFNVEQIPTDAIYEVNRVNPAQMQIFALACLWLLGVAVFVGYNLITLALLRRRLRDAQAIAPDCFVSNRIDTPFVLGMLRPRIYLPATLNEDERSLILLHERMHIRRRDHIAKLIGFVVLALHWFNPLVWIAFHYFERDMEMSCDEAVTREMTADRRADYSSLLLSLSIGRRPAAPHLAFGESDTGARIKHVLSFKRPAVWVCIIALIAVVVFGVAMMFSRAEDDVIDNQPPVTEDGAVTTDGQTAQDTEIKEIALNEQIRFIVYPVPFSDADEVMFDVTVDDGKTWTHVTRGDVPTSNAVGYYTRNFSTSPIYGSYTGDVISFQYQGDTLIMKLEDPLRDMTGSVYHSTDNGRSWTLVQSYAPEYYNVDYDKVTLTLKVPHGWQFYNHGRLADEQGIDRAYLNVTIEDSTELFPRDDIEAQKRVLLKGIAAYADLVDPNDKTAWQDGIRFFSENPDPSGDGLISICGHTRYRMREGEDPKPVLLTAFHHDGKNYYASLTLMQDDYTNDALSAMHHGGFGFSERVQKEEQVFVKTPIVIDGVKITLPLPQRCVYNGIGFLSGGEYIGTVTLDKTVWREPTADVWATIFAGYLDHTTADLWDIKPSVVYFGAESGVMMTHHRKAGSDAEYPAILAFLRDGNDLYRVIITYDPGTFDDDTLRKIAESTTLAKSLTGFLKQSISVPAYRYDSKTETGRYIIPYDMTLDLPQEWKITYPAKDELIDQSKPAVHFTAGNSVTAWITFSSSAWEDNAVGQTSMYFSGIIDGTDSLETVRDNHATGVFLTENPPTIFTYLRSGNTTHRAKIDFDHASVDRTTLRAIADSLWIGRNMQKQVFTFPAYDQPVGLLESQYIDRPFTVTVPIPSGWTIKNDPTDTYHSATPISLLSHGDSAGTLYGGVGYWDDSRATDPKMRFHNYSFNRNTSWDYHVEMLIDTGEQGVGLTTWNGSPALITYLRGGDRVYQSLITFSERAFDLDTLRAIGREISVGFVDNDARPAYVRQNVTFPAYDLRDGLHENWYIDPFTLTLPLPQGWTLREPSADEKAKAFGTPLYIYNGDKQVGMLRYDTATWIESGAGDFMMYFQGYMMGSIIAWDVDPEMVIDTGTSGVAVTTKRVNQMDGIAAAASTVKYYPAMLCYLRNGETIYQVAIEFAEDTFDRDTLRQMAEATTLNLVAKTEN